MLSEPQLNLFQAELSQEHQSPLNSPVICSDDFPFEQLSTIAVPESFRKEIYRPIYHIHKWWAQRLGSVFRGILIGAHIGDAQDFLHRFYSYNDFSGTIVFDPFMGSGTTLGEAFKLGCTALGRDINPIAFQNVRISLSKMDSKEVVEAFGKLENTVAQTLKGFYKSFDSDGNECEVLYYFWVKYLECPNCSNEVDLFSNYIFAKHAYVLRNPKVQVVCPKCYQINESNFHHHEIECRDCSYKFNPHIGQVKGPNVECNHCGTKFSVSKVAKLANTPPKSRMYAKLVLRQDGKKEYLRINGHDFDLYKKASEMLLTINQEAPDNSIEPGYNTNQVLNYGYTKWNQFFNNRQLYCLLTLLNEIKRIEDDDVRDVLGLLFSAVLEFNNNFNSYKGEGTGAVRHLFYHHVLKPERTPIEANLWGTPKSSGSFSTLFRSRVMRAIAYQKDPFELVIAKKNAKKFGISRPFDQEVSIDWPPPMAIKNRISISCGSSDRTHLQDLSVDLIVTDPPFFDNVHYSELADFFYSWSNIIYGYQINGSTTTRSKEEVQDTNSDSFSTKLQSVLTECHRILKESGLLIFSYHHSRKEGWSSVAKAVVDAGFSFIQSHPVKAEMSVATPKLQAKSPIDYDIILVCRKTANDEREFLSIESVLDESKKSLLNKIGRLKSVGLKLSANDVKIIANGELLKFLSPKRTSLELLADFQVCNDQLTEFLNEIYLQN